MRRRKPDGQVHLRRYLPSRQPDWTSQIICIRLCSSVDDIDIVQCVVHVATYMLSCRGVKVFLSLSLSILVDKTGSVQVIKFLVDLGART